MSSDLWKCYRMHLTDVNWRSRSSGINPSHRQGKGLFQNAHSRNERRARTAASASALEPERLLETLYHPQGNQHRRLDIDSGHPQRILLDGLRKCAGPRWQSRCGHSEVLRRHSAAPIVPRSTSGACSTHAERLATRLKSTCLLRSPWFRTSTAVRGASGTAVACVFFPGRGAGSSGRTVQSE